MKKLIIITAILLIVAAVAGIAFTLLNRTMVPAPSDTTGTQPADPFGSVTVVPAPEGKVPLTLKNGTQIFVDEFVPAEQPEWAGDTGYNLFGTESDAYRAVYIPGDARGSQATFVISILQEPLGANRKLAEDALRSLLNVSNAEMCALDVQIAVSASLSETYAGRNLGLSFCPGSVLLP